MATRKAAQSEIVETKQPQLSPLSSVFGRRPESGIYIPNRPQSIRFNCQSGLICGDSGKPRAGKQMDRLEAAIIKIGQFVGDLGKTTNTEWIQLFLVGSENEDKLSANTVYVAYLKTRSMTAFYGQVNDLIGAGKNPATGIFKFSFEKFSGADADGKPIDYYGVVTEWREREHHEIAQLEEIEALLSSNLANHLIDLDGTKDMIDCDGYSPLETQNMIQYLKSGESLNELRQRLRDGAL